MQRFHDIFPTADELTTRTPEELAPILLRLAQAQGGNGFIPESVTQVPVGTGVTLEYTNGYPFHKKHAVDLCLNSAWQWMERQGLIEPAPGMNGRHGWRIITADGVKVIESDSVEKFLAAKGFPKSLLHPRIREKCWSALARGDYPGACRTALIGVEEAVREAGGFTADDYGVDLMRAAFRLNTGPLARASEPKAEQEGMAHLFAGAIGAFKNRHSHREVTIDDVTEAQDQLLLASHLLRIVDARRPV